MTKFQLKVYKAVLKIPFGQIRTYKWVAKQINKPKAMRAVGQALNKNPYPFIIPCHRVVACNNEIGGYAWGKKNKKKLLDLERQIKNLTPKFT